MSELKFITYTIGNRDLSGHFKAIPSMELVYDRFHNIVDTYRLALAALGDSPGIIFEDDIIFCNGFLDKAKKEIAEHPDTLMQFFTGHLRNYTESQYIDDFVGFTQSTYFPKGMAKDILSYSYMWHGLLKVFTGTDCIISAYRTYHKLKTWVVVPNLIQHMDLVSEVNPSRSKKRQSPNFIG